MIIVGTAILIAGVIDDFRFRKFHNWLFLTCAAVALVAAIWTQGPWGLNYAVLGFLAGIAFYLPLVLLKVVGAGDMKMMAAVGIVAGATGVLAIGVYSLFWGAAFGVLQIALRGQLTTLFKNLKSMIVYRTGSQTELHKIPFTAACLLGWFSYLVAPGVFS